MFAWPEQPLILYRVVEYRADGELRYLRPLWLIYLQANGAAPSTAQAQAIYQCRFGIEHNIGFTKRELGLISGQFNGNDALLRVALWVELVATVFWMLLALSTVADFAAAKLPPWWRKRPRTPGATKSLALSLFISLGIAPQKPLTRGKSPGRALGARFEPRKRFRIFRRRKRRSVA